VFDEINGSQVEQYNLDVVDDEDAPCDALQKMAIGDVRPQDPNEYEASHAPNDTTPPTQDHEQDKEDKHKKPQNEDQVYD
jgi:hypothetical protein